MIRSSAIRYAPDGMALHQYLSLQFDEVKWRPIKRPPNVKYALAKDVLLLAAGATINEGVKLISAALRDWLRTNRDVKSIEILDSEGNVLRTVRPSRKK